MNINSILNNVNAKLAGELLSYDELKVHLDSVIDDINQKLSSKFPAFSEFTAEVYPQYPDYNFFPDKYIRSVVCTGAAYYFYITDEEGASAATEYTRMYMNNMFMMQRDYSVNVPEEYRDYEQGYLVDPNYPGTKDNTATLADLIWGDI